MPSYRTAVATLAAATLMLSASPAAAATAHVTTYHPPAGTDGPFGITDGPGGVWFSHGGTIDRISAGVITQFPLPNKTKAVSGWLTYFGGNKVWFADQGLGRVGTITSTGHVREWQLPAGSGGVASPHALVIGPGSNIWLTDQFNDRIDRLNTTTGKVTVYPVPTSAGEPLGLTRGADGALWFTERAVDKLGRLSADGVFREWSLPKGAFPNRIVVGPDHLIWFTELKINRVGHITAAGSLVQTSVPGGPVGLTVGHDGHLYTVLYTAGKLARLNSSGRISATWMLPKATGALQVAQRGNAFWVGDPFGNLLWRVDPGR